MNKGHKNEGIVAHIVAPFHRFFNIQASTGIALIISTIIAMVWANSDWSYLYYAIREYKIEFIFQGHHFSKSLLFYVNDGLMSLFFLVVGLEIKRELIVGELSTFKHASLPFSAAIGGMLLPALIFLLFNTNPLYTKAWGIPMATDIAFAIGILSLMGNRVPFGLKIFLAAFAIVDDIGAMIVITLFYSSGIDWSFLFAGGLFMITLVLMNILNFRYLLIYFIIGLGLWYCLSCAGIHPTISGILIAFALPARRKTNLALFIKKIEDDIDEFGKDHTFNKVTLSNSQIAAIDNIGHRIKQVQSPLQYVNHHIHGFVLHFVMPLFALFNAGIALDNPSSLLTNGSLTLNIASAMLSGKVIGISLFSLIAVKTGISSLPNRVKWNQIIGVGFLGGVGFTIALFINNLAFLDPLVQNHAKAGILMGSIVSGVIGFIIIRKTLYKRKTHHHY